MFSLCVRERAEWTCECCGKQYAEGSRGLHCSHFWSRRNQSVRHDPDNAAAHCFACHQHLGGNPVEFRDWILAHLGPRDYDALRDRANRLFRIKPHLKDIAKHYEKEHFKLTAQRGRGKTGRLEFARWEMP